ASSVATHAQPAPLVTPAITPTARSRYVDRPVASPSTRHAGTTRPTDPATTPDDARATSTDPAPTRDNTPTTQPSNPAITPTPSTPEPPAPFKIEPSAVERPVDRPSLRPITSHLGWAIDLDAFIQVDSVPWSNASLDELSPSTGKPLDEETLYVRRAFFRMSGRRDRFTASFEIDANSVNGPVARLLGAQVGWSYPKIEHPLLALSAGLMLIPFGIATPTNARYRPFMEQPTFLTAFFPGEYDTGVSARGEYGLANWTVAVMNGAPTKDAQWKGLDPLSSYDFLGRLGVAVDGPRRSHVEAGVSALAGTGLHPGTPATKDQLVWVDENKDGLVEDSELQVIPGSPAVASQTYHRNAVGADASVSWCLDVAGRGQLFFEGMIATNLDRGVIYADPIASSRSIRELGFEIGVVQDVTPHVQLGVRYDRYDADRDASEVTGETLVRTHQTFSTLAGMAAYRWHTVRLMGEYDHGRNPFGLADDGTPTSISDDRLVFRAQVEL
ncbi:MAG TPA: hypothetical protein VGO00_28025, partial [Kofleriaceae bacterium]|nr:hypothetical protein [Kofleriaceae bacterium]